MRFLKIYAPMTIVIGALLALIVNIAGWGAYFMISIKSHAFLVGLGGGALILSYSDASVWLPYPPQAPNTTTLPVPGSSYVTARMMSCDFDIFAFGLNGEDGSWLLEMPILLVAILLAVGLRALARWVESRSGINHENNV